jgi:hypothetical protein
MPDRPLPCCPEGTPEHRRDLDHYYGLDFDLFRCGSCRRYWVWGWYAGTARGAWEEIHQEHAAALERMREEQVERYMRNWARQFQ